MIRSILAVSKCGVVFLAFIGTVGGVADDIPEVKDEPATIEVLRLASIVVRNALHIATSHPIGVALAFATTVFFHWAFTIPRDHRLRKEFENERLQERNRQRPAAVADRQKRRKRGPKR